MTVFSPPGNSRPSTWTRHVPGVSTCFKSMQKSVDVYPTIITNVFPDKTEICSGELVRFTNQSFGVSAAGSKWFYRVQGDVLPIPGTVLTSKNVNYTLINTTASNPIIYEVVYQATNGFCPASDVIKPITVYRAVTASYDEGPLPHLLVGGNSFVTFTNTSVPVDPAFRYDWDFGLDATPLTTATGVGPFTVDYISQGPRDATLTATNIAAETAGLSCVSQFTKTITITVPPLLVDIEVVPPASCFPSSITVIKNNSTGDRFLWKLYDQNGSLVLTSIESLPVFLITNPGRYTLTFQTSDHLTGQVALLNPPQDFDIYAPPIASYDVRPLVVFVPDTELSTFNYSMGSNGSICVACDYLWKFGDGFDTLGFEPSHKYKIEGKYDITLIVSEDHGDAICTDTLKRAITARQGGVAKVPNAFTPNPNGGGGMGGHSNGGGGGSGGGSNGSFNDVFLPIVKGVEEFNMQIFDRWGNLIFESNSSTDGWTGYNQDNKLMPAGVYVYKLTIRLSDDQRSTQIGDITMIR